MIKVHYSFAGGSGGLSLVEADSAAAMYEAALPWIPFVEFRIVPILDIEKGFPMAAVAIAWRDSVEH